MTSRFTRILRRTILSLCTLVPAGLLGACAATEARIVIQNESSVPVVAQLQPATDGAAEPTRLTLDSAGSSALLWNDEGGVSMSVSIPGRGGGGEVEFDPRRTGLVRIQNDGLGGVRIVFTDEVPLQNVDMIPEDPRARGFNYDQPPINTLPSIPGIQNR